MPIGHLVDLSNAYPVLIGIHMLGNDVHRDFCKIEIRTDAGGGRDPGFMQDIPYHRHCQFIRRHFVGGQILRDVNENLIYGVDNDVFLCHVLQIDPVDFGGDLHVSSHPGRRYEVVQFHRRVRGQNLRVEGFVLELSFPVSNAPAVVPQPFRVDFLDLLDDLKQSRASGDTLRFQGRRNRQTYGFLRPAHIRNDQICGERIEFPVSAFAGGIVGFQIYRNIDMIVFHAYAFTSTNHLPGLPEK